MPLQMLPGLRRCRGHWRVGPLLQSVSAPTHFLSELSRVRSWSELPQALRCTARRARGRSEEHTSELQSHLNLVCRLLLEKKKKYLVTVGVIQSIVTQRNQPHAVAPHSRVAEDSLPLR